MENLQEILEKLGATYISTSKAEHGDWWKLPRLDIIYKTTSNGDQWLLIGEITEALEEAGASDFDHSNEHKRLMVWLNEWHTFKGERLEAYIAAAKELL